MGMCTYLKVFTELPASGKEMMEVKNLCDAKGLSYPKEVQEFLENTGEDDDILDGKYAAISDADPHFTKVDDEYRDVWEVDIDSLPEGTKKIRFYNSY